MRDHTQQSCSVCLSFFFEKLARGVAASNSGVDIQFNVASCVLRCSQNKMHLCGIMVADCTFKTLYGVFVCLFVCLFRIK